MNLTEENTSELLNNEFSIDFAKITLTQKGCEEPIIYSGPGTISQKDDGMFHLKLYHSFVDVTKELFGDTGQLRPGKIIGDEHYFSLSAVDIRGQVWTADQVSVPGELNFPAAGKVIKSAIGELTKVEPREESDDKTKSYLLMLVKGDFKIPPNEIEERNGYRCLNTCKIANESLQLEVRSRDGHLRIRMSGDGSAINENTNELLIEALSIILGKIVTPVFSGFAHGENVVTSLISTPVRFPNRTVAEPMPHSSSKHVAPVKEFIEKYLLIVTAPHAELYGFWHKINRAWQGGIENAALATTVAIEGITKTYFKEYGLPDDDFLIQADAALEPIKKLDIGDRIRERILSSIGQAKNSNPKSALFKLAAYGYFNKDLVKEWIALRNLSAHADKLDPGEVQKYIDKVYKCLLLFYNLIFILLDYENLYNDFSRDGWPEVLFKIPKSA